MYTDIHHHDIYQFHYFQFECRKTSIFNLINNLFINWIIMSKIIIQMPGKKLLKILSRKCTKTCSHEKIDYDEHLWIQYE